MESLTGKFCYSHNEDDYYGEFDTYDDAMTEALAFHDPQDIKIGCYGEMVEWEVDAENVLEMIAEETESQSLACFEEGVLQYVDLPEGSCLLDELKAAIMNVLKKYPIDYAPVYPVEDRKA